MHTEYESLTDNDIAALQAEAAYFDQLAQEQAAAPQPMFRHPPVNYLALAERYLDEYERKSTGEAAYSADRSYKLALLNATIAQAEAAKRQAKVMESLQDFLVEWFVR